MKYFFLGTLFFLSTFLNAQTTTNDLSTLRIGPFTLLMAKAKAEEIAGKKLVTADSSNQYEGSTKVNYKGATIEIFIQNYYDEASKKDIPKINRMVSGSNQFKTKKGVGVGNTKYELLEAYKDFASINIGPEWDDVTQKWSKTDSHFTLTDNDANTVLAFKLKNNIVVEVSVYISDGDCC